MNSLDYDFNSVKIFESIRIEATDFLYHRSDAMTNLRFLLVMLASRMPWGVIEACLGLIFARRDRLGPNIDRHDMPGR